MSSPLYGNQYSKKFNATFYMKAYTAATTKPTTAAGVLTEFDGVAQVTEYAIEASATDKYIIVSSPVSAYCVWFDEGGVGTAPSLPSGCTALLPVTVTDATDIDELGAAIATAINTTKDISATHSTSTDLVIATASQGGTVVLTPTYGITGWTGTPIDISTPGAGGWMKIGGVAEDYSTEPSPNEIRDTEGNVIVTYEDMDIKYSLMNVNERNLNILRDANRTQVSIAIVDKSNTSLPKVACWDNLTANFGLMLSGDTASIPISLSKRLEDSLSGTSYWSYDPASLST